LSRAVVVIMITNRNLLVVYLLYDEERMAMQTPRFIPDDDDSRSVELKVP